MWYSWSNNILKTKPFFGLMVIGNLNILFSNCILFREKRYSSNEDENIRQIKLFTWGNLSMSMLCERLRHLRNTRNWTQEDVAKNLGIPKPTYVGYEAGKRKPNPNVIIKITDLYNTNADYILGITDDPTPSNKENNLRDIKELLQQGEYTFRGKPVAAEDIGLVISILNRMVKPGNSEEDKVKSDGEEREKSELYKG